jgi:16S rRNA (guanine(966)-N(2))-methyltransferase RsmD
LDRVKESLFNILQTHIAGARVLDLYAGSGNLGLEALSRGADFALFNDHERICVALIKKNLKTLGFENRARVMGLDALRAVESLVCELPFDIVFVDPPYKESALSALSALFENGLVAKGGRVVIEHAWALPPDPAPAEAYCTGRRKFGDTGLSFFIHESERV